MKRGALLGILLLSVLLSILCVSVSAEGEARLNLPGDAEEMTARLILPGGTEEIEEEAFCGNTAIRRVVLPEGIRRIGARAFADSGLTAINLPDGLIFIDPTAFDGLRNVAVTANPGTYAYAWAADRGMLSDEPGVPITAPVDPSGGGAEQRPPEAGRGIPRAGLEGYSQLRPQVSAHTPADIIAFADAHPIEPSGDENPYRRSPAGPSFDGGDTYVPGLLSKETIQYGLNAVNLARYIAGLNANVVNDPQMEEAVAAAAMVNSLNGFLSHNPYCPPELSDAKYDALYSLAVKGASSSNLHGVSVVRSILGENTYMSDSDSSNIDAVGHRRWVLNPGMGKTAFGQCGSSSAMYAFDRSGGGGQSLVCWPGQQMPTKYFSASHAWSVSYGKSLPVNQIEVTLTRQSDGKAWHFSAAGGDGYFNVDNDWYGQPGCVIFRPDGVSSYRPGDVFDVCVVNHGDRTALTYTVVFFNMDERPPQRTPGDANGDGEVDITDAMLVLRFTCGWKVDLNRANSDVNGDGSTDIGDAMLILRYTCGWHVTLK